MTIAQELSFGYSPTSSHSAEYDDALNPLVFDDDFGTELGLNDDGDDDDDDRDDLAGSNAGTTSKPKRSNNRKGPGNADKRATHNAVERARRESLNGRFTTLAESLPTMRHIKRPSKAMIVNKALDFVYDAQLRERTLVQENNELRREVDQLRARLGMPPLPPPAPLPESKPATQPTMRKSRKAQSVSASISTGPSVAASDSQSPAGVVVAASPSIDGAYPSPTVSAPSAGHPSYDSPSLPNFPALFPGQDVATAPSPTDTLASAASPATMNPFLPGFDQAALAQASAGSAAGFPLGMFNPSMLQAHIAAVQAGLMPPQALYNSQAAYLNNPALLYAMQAHQHAAAHQQQQQQRQHHVQQPAQQSPPSTSSSPASFGSFSQTAVAAGPDSSSSLWASTPPSWGPFSQQTPTVDGLTF